MKRKMIDAQGIVSGQKGGEEGERKGKQLDEKQDDEDEEKNDRRISPENGREEKGKFSSREKDAQLVFRDRRDKRKSGGGEGEKGSGGGGGGIGGDGDGVYDKSVDDGGSGAMTR